jgi:membrane-bound ClpP family serine protease
MQPLAPRGYVRLQGELWHAETAHVEQTIGAGATIEVVEASGLTLVVREAGSARPSR